MGEKLIGACGLVCSDCEAYVATQANDAAAIERIAAQWSEQWKVVIPPEAVSCDGCMPGGERACAHVGECDIRACAVKRDLTNCAGCADYACDQLTKFFEMAPAARESLESLRV